MHKTKSGFTIVELLIVIVVIGILAAITIVAYNGIQDRAKTSSAQAAANALVKKIETYYAINGQYPGTAGVITGSGTQNGVTTTTSSDWYSPPSATATQASAGPSAALATSPNRLWAFPCLAGPGGPGGSIYYWNYTTKSAAFVPYGNRSTCSTATIGVDIGIPY